MNNKQTSPKKIWLALASAIANALACDETPAELADSLQELDNCLVELLTDHKYGHTIALLRGLTLDAQSGRSLMCVKVKKAPTANPGAKNGALNQRRQVDMPREIKNDPTAPGAVFIRPGAVVDESQALAASVN